MIVKMHFSEMKKRRLLAAEITKTRNLIDKIIFPPEAWGEIRKKSEKGGIFKVEVKGVYRFFVEFLVKEGY